MHTLGTVAPTFVEMAHRIVWCVAATTSADGGPRTRVLHPIWEWNDGTLTGWIASAASIGVSYPHTTPSCRVPPTSALQYEASPLNGHVVWNEVASSRSIRTSSLGM